MARNHRPFHISFTDPLTTARANVTQSMISPRLSGLIGFNSLQLKRSGWDSRLTLILLLSVPKIIATSLRQSISAGPPPALIEPHIYHTTLYISVSETSGYRAFRISWTLLNPLQVATRVIQEDVIGCDL